VGGSNSLEAIEDFRKKTDNWTASNSFEAYNFPIAFQIVVLKLIDREENQGYEGKGPVEEGKAAHNNISQERVECSKNAFCGEDEFII